MAIGIRANANKKKPRKGALPQEFIDRINRMKPEDVAVEAAREQLAIDTLKKEMKEDQKINDAKDLVTKLNDEIDAEKDVVEARAKLEEALQAHQDNDDYRTAKLDVKLHSLDWTQDISKRRKELKHMMKTIKSHIDSGALKLKP